MSQAWLATYNASDSYQWKFLVSLLKPAHLKRWANRKHLTQLEFGFISSGLEPIPNEFLLNVMEELQAIMHNINRKVSFESLQYSDKTFIPSIKELFPHIKKEEDAKERILEQAQHLLDCLEMIHRSMMAMPEECQACFSNEQGALKEKLWRFDFLVHWAKTDLNFSLPSEICMLDNNFNIQKFISINAFYSYSIFYTIFKFRPSDF